MKREVIGVELDAIQEEILLSDKRSIDAVPVVQDFLPREFSVAASSLRSHPSRGAFSTEPECNEILGSSSSNNLHTREGIPPTATML